MDFYLRTESIKTEDILNLSVVNNADLEIIEALKSEEPCLLEGSRGTGKSFLMRVAELQLEKERPSCITAFVSFNVSSLISTDDTLQFYHWMLAKTLRFLLSKLRRRGIVVSELVANLLSKDEMDNEEKIKRSLSKIVKMFEESYKNNSNIDTSSIPDIEEVKEAIQIICEKNNIDRVVIFFDEAAHVFRPDQQRQFFSLFRDLRSPFITCNAAIYPGVTHFGSSFEPIHDCIYKKIERNISDSDYLDYFAELVLKQSKPVLRKAIEENKALFNTMALSSGGNARILLRTVQSLRKLNTSEVNKVIKEFYRNVIWLEHTDLGDKYEGHKPLIDWGRNFLENTVIPRIQSYNSTRKDKSVDESTIYFWIQKDEPEFVKESLRLLTYTGIIRKLDSAVRATRSELGTRFEVKYGCIISLEAYPQAESYNFYNNLSLKKYPEFGKRHPSYVGGETLLQSDKAQYTRSLQSLLDRPIEVLVGLTKWQIDKLIASGITKIRDLHDKSEEHLMQKIYGVGPARARTIKNTVTAELLEYISG